MKRAERSAHAASIIPTASIPANVAAAAALPSRRRRRIASPQLASRRPCDTRTHPKTERDPVQAERVRRRLIVATQPCKSRLFSADQKAMNNLSRTESELLVRYSNANTSWTNELRRSVHFRCGGLLVPVPLVPFVQRDKYSHRRRIRLFDPIRPSRTLRPLSRTRQCGGSQSAVLRHRADRQHLCAGCRHGHAPAEQPGLRDHLLPALLHRQSNHPRQGPQGP